jgi:hypothetical protein
LNTWEPETVIADVTTPAAIAMNQQKSSHYINNQSWQ